MKAERKRLESETGQKRLESEAEKERLLRERETEEKRLEKEREIDEKRLERKIKEKRLEKEVEEKQLERKVKSKPEKLTARLELERLQLKRARVEGENIEARAEVQSTVNAATVIKLLGYLVLSIEKVLGKLAIYCGLRNTRPLRIGNEIRGLFGLAHCLLIKH